MVDFIATLIAFVVYCGLSWLVTVGIIKLITLCFGWSFSLLTATGIWLILMGIIEIVYSFKIKSATGN